MIDAYEKFLREYCEEAGRRERKEFYSGILGVIDAAPKPKHDDLPHAFTAEEKAGVLRHIAGQLETEAQRRGPVGRSADRIAARPQTFFGQAVFKAGSLPPKDWSDELKAKGEQHQPMRHFKPLPVRNPDCDRER